MNDIAHAIIFPASQLLNSLFLFKQWLRQTRCGKTKSPSSSSAHQHVANANKQKSNHKREQNVDNLLILVITC